MNNCACNRCVSVFVSVSFKCAWFESWDVPRVILAKVRVNQTKLVSFKLRERAYSHTLTRTYTTYIKKAKPNGKTPNYRSRLVANQLPLWSWVYCYIVHSSLWPNARVLTKSVLFAVWRLFILHSLTFYFERSLFVVRSFCSIISKKVKWIVYVYMGFVLHTLKMGFYCCWRFIFHFFSLVLFTMRNVGRIKHARTHDYICKIRSYVIVCVSMLKMPYFHSMLIVICCSLFRNPVKLKCLFLK